MSRDTLTMAVLAIAAVAIAAAGCIDATRDESTMAGASLFNPYGFSMATYDVSVAAGDNISRQSMIVATRTGSAEGNLLISIAFHDNVSTRAEALISADGRKTLGVLISDVNESSMQISGGSPLFNMTVYDLAWNTLDDVYRSKGTANVTVPAGTYPGCTIYGLSKSLVFGNSTTSANVFYYMHRSSPVPVMYTVETPSAIYTYKLKSVYGPGENATTPERAVFAFFDYLDAGRLDDAFQRLVTYDNMTGRYVPPDDSTYKEFLSNMNRTYQPGDEGYRVQYVNVRSVQPVITLLSDNMSLVQWDSVHFQAGTLNVYRLSGSFYVTEAGGQWRIIA